jgi:hypothetical protein
MSKALGQTRKMNSCSAKTKEGKPCRAAATAGGLCFFHANPKKASELGRIGGHKNRRRPVEMDPLPLLDSPTAVRTTFQRVILEVYSGQLSARTGAVLGALLNAQLRAIESTDHELRMKQLEQRVEEGMNQDDTSVPKLQERVKQLEHQLGRNQRYIGPEARESRWKG